MSAISVDAQFAKQSKDSFEKFAEATTPAYSIQRPYYIIKGITTSIPRLKIVRQISDELVIVEISSAQQLVQIAAITTVVPANDIWKLSPSFEHEPDDEPEMIQVYTLVGNNLESLLRRLHDLKEVEIINKDLLSHSIVVKTTSSFLKKKLLQLPEIVFADKLFLARPEIKIVGYNRGFHGINAVDYAIPGANAAGITVGIKEQRINETDIDLFKRVLPSTLSGGNVTGHATVVASIVGGAGNSFYDGRGIAYECNLYPSSFNNLFADDLAVLAANKVFVQNHSYGTVVQQYYGAEAVSYDVQTWTNKNLLHVFSAGNAGTSFATEGKYANIAGYANLTANFKMAKNVITVAATDNKGNIAAASSAGPAYDGRLSPQLTALGPSGTSDAAAIVSGTVAVMQQAYADSNSHQLPPASLLKAILYNTADDIYRKGIDFKTGFGLINSYDAIRSLQKREYAGSVVSNVQVWNKTINIPANTAQLKVTLVWTDTAANANNSKALINDLDLEIIHEPSNARYLPWILSNSPHADSLSKLPVRGRDSLNVAEQVSIERPASGDYTILVKGFAVVNDVLPFHIAYHIDTINSFQFRSPQHASDVNMEENDSLRILWKTNVADSNQAGQLSISYDRGNRWQLISASQKLSSQEYYWPIKDTASTAVFRMQTSFGNFLSKEFILSPVLQPHVDFLCIDSFAISWNKHIYAARYDLYAFVDSAYLKLVGNTVDTAIVLNKKNFPWQQYAVEPILSNGLPAARSRILNIQSQNAKCFYQTFYYVLQDQNILDLVLELGAAAYVDSMIFDQVSSQGQIIKRVGSQKAFVGATLYHQMASDLPMGTSYWRATIKLKSGDIVFTDIIAVQTSGKQYIQFYPNPTSRSEPLVYVLQQGVDAGAQLQFFDITGRMLKNYIELPGRINVSSFPVGVIIFRLLDSEGRLLETGKIILN